MENEDSQNLERIAKNTAFLSWVIIISMSLAGLVFLMKGH